MVCGTFLLHSIWNQRSVYSLLCRDTGKMIKEMDNVLAYNAKLAAVATQADASDLMPGIGPVSVLGTCLHNSSSTYSISCTLLVNHSPRPCHQ